MPRVRFEPTIPEGGRPQTHALDRAATGMDVDIRCPIRYRTRHFFNNFTTNEDIATKYRHTLQTAQSD